MCMSWGYDEYPYHITKDHLPEPALYMIRYHSFYAQHREGACDYLMDDHDREMFEWVKKFNPMICTQESSAAQPEGVEAVLRGSDRGSITKTIRF